MTDLEELVKLYLESLKKIAKLEKEKEECVYKIFDLEGDNSNLEREYAQCEKEN